MDAALLKSLNVERQPDGIVFTYKNMTYNLDKLVSYGPRLSPTCAICRRDVCYTPCSLIGYHVLDLCAYCHGSIEDFMMIVESDNPLNQIYVKYNMHYEKAITSYSYTDIEFSMLRSSSDTNIFDHVHHVLLIKYIVTTRLTIDVYKCLVFGYLNECVYQN